MYFSQMMQNYHGTYFSMYHGFINSIRQIKRCKILYCSSLTRFKAAFPCTIDIPRFAVKFRVSQRIFSTLDGPLSFVDPISWQLSRRLFFPYFFSTQRQNWRTSTQRMEGGGSITNHSLKRASRPIWGLMVNKNPRSLRGN